MSIYVCQICSRVGITSGLCHTMAHQVIAAGRHEFICRRCVRPDEAVAILEQQRHRFCFLCRERTGTTAGERFEHRVWCCADCQKNIAAKGLAEATAACRRWDTAALQAFLDAARSEAECRLHKNAVDWFNEAIPICENLVRAGFVEWTETLGTAQRELAGSLREVEEDDRDPERARRRDATKTGLVLAHARLSGGLLRADRGETEAALAMFKELVAVCETEGDGSEEWLYLQVEAQQLIRALHENENNSG
jgi:hypothetical protein